MRDADSYLDEQLRQLETLIARHPASAEVRSARRLAARTRYHLRRGLPPLKRRHLLADLRTLTRKLERTYDD